MSKPLPEFARPPIVELVLGVQFAPLARLTSGHFGWYWRQYLGEEWVNATDAAVLADQFETFDERGRWRVPEMQLTLEPAPKPPRLQIVNRAGDRLIQVQQTRFHYNWKKKEQVYPSYGAVLAEFEKHFGKFQSFVSESSQDKLVANQWELTYVDAVPQGELWQTVGDWHNVLPGIISATPTTEGLKLENVGGEWNFEIAPRRGRVHVSVRQARPAEETVLLIQTTARGPIGKEAGQDLKAGLDLGHDAAVRAFAQITSSQAHKHWGLKS